MLDDATLMEVVEVGLIRIDYDLSGNRSGGNWSAWTGTNILWGTGVRDLDRAIEMATSYPFSSFKLDVGVKGGKDSSWLEVGVPDLQRLRELFVQTWGNVNKTSGWINEWESTPPPVIGPIRYYLVDPELVHYIVDPEGYFIVSPNETV